MVKPDGTAAETTLTLAQLALTPAQPYIASNADVVLRSGEVSTAGRLTYRAGRERAALAYTGSVDVNAVNLIEATTGDPVVAWKAMHVEALRFGLAPDRLEIAEVRLIGLDGRLMIFKDKSVSVAKLMKPAGAPASSAPAANVAPKVAAQPAAGDSAASPGFPMVIERVRLEDSAMTFGDLSLILPFQTRVHGLNGVVVGIGSDPESRSTMRLDGRVDEFGLVKVEGALNAVRPKVCRP